MSDPESIKQAGRPLTPSAPNVVFDVDTDIITVAWAKPGINGAEISSYSVLVADVEGTVFHKTECSAISPTATTCEIKLAALFEDPLKLHLGSSMDTKITATNEMGTSDLSD